MDERLQGAVENAYAVFAGARLGPRLIVCRCCLCFSTDDYSLQVERRLTKSPLREIRAEDIRKLTESAHGWHEQTRYFLPRILDLLAKDEEANRNGNAHALARLGFIDWRGDWPNAERQALEIFFDTWFAFALARPPTGRNTMPVEVLACVCHAGGSIRRLLERLDASGGRWTAWHAAEIVNLTVPYPWSPQGLRFGWKRDADAARELVEWLYAPDLPDRLERSFFMADDPTEQQGLSDAVELLRAPDLHGRLRGGDTKEG